MSCIFYCKILIFVWNDKNDIFVGYILLEKLIKGLYCSKIILLSFVKK